jgi:exopolysaccharide production protein ExoQ
MKISYKVIGDIFTFFVLFISTSAFVSLIVGPGLQGSEGGSPFTQGIWLVVYVVVIARVASWHRLLIPLIWANKSLCALVLLALVSAAWSWDSVATLHHGVALLVTTLFGIDFALRYSIREQLRFVCIVLASVIALSIAAELFFSGVLPHFDPNPAIWQGVFGQKNTLGKIVVLAAAAFLSRSRDSRKDTFVVVALMVIAGVVVMAAHSASSLVELIAIILISRALVSLRWRRESLIIAVFVTLLIAIPATFVVLKNFDRVTAALGRDATLTGRTEVWRLARQSIAAHPVLGYGYDVFWEYSSREATRIRSEVMWDVPNAHNGLLDVLLDVGIVGLLLYGIAYIVTLRRVSVLFRSDSANELMWPLLFLAVGLLCQVTESSIVKPNSIYWILFVAVSVSVTGARISVEHRAPDEDPAQSLPDAVPTEA